MKTKNDELATYAQMFQQKIQHELFLVSKYFFFKLAKLVLTRLVTNPASAKLESMH